MYIVGFNGPPESGKDTLAEMVADRLDKAGITLPVRFESLSLPLRSIAYAMVGRNYEAMQHIKHGPGSYESFKREWFDGLLRDGRHLMIDASENFLKPTYGIGVMAKLLLDRNKDFPGILLIRDSGFQCEIDPLIEAVGERNCMIVQVHREGKSFDNDSREWVSHVLMGQVDNNGTLDDLRVDAGNIVDALWDTLGWKL